jgi:FKBP-type peptidyl-prolyl cis-trans isomerase FkpA
MKKSIFFIACLLSTAFMACLVNAQDYQTTKTGMKYKFFAQDKQGVKPKVGDVVTIAACFKTKDTVFLDSRKTKMPFVFPIIESVYPGDISEALRMMSINDSAEFVQNGDSLFIKYFRQKELPRYIKPGTPVITAMKILKIQSNEDFQADMKSKMESQQKRMDHMKVKEDSLMNVYIKQNNITAKPSETGVYVIEKQKGSGAKVQAGKKVKVHYTGKLSNGGKFDSSYDRGTPIEVEVGKGQVIKGWEEALLKMNVGGKYQVIIPSKMGYGEKGFGAAIPPYQPLIFDMEVVEMK